MLIETHKFSFKKMHLKISSTKRILGNVHTAVGHNRGPPIVGTLTHLHLDKMATILADDIFKRIFLNENGRVPIQISLKFVPKNPIDN